MKTKVNKENWQEQAPTLAQMEKINPFSVPEGYFDTLSERINHSIAQAAQKPAKTKVILMWTRYAAAACLTCILGITLYINLNQTAPAAVKWEDIPDHEIVAYLEMNLEDADAALIINNLEDKASPGLANGASQQELETYINQNL